MPEPSALPPERIFATALRQVHGLCKESVERLDHHEAEIMILRETMTLVVEQLRQLTGCSWEEIFAQKGLPCPDELKEGGKFSV